MRLGRERHHVRMQEFGEVVEVAVVELGEEHGDRGARRIPQRAVRLWEHGRQREGPTSEELLEHDLVEWTVG